MDNRYRKLLKTLIEQYVKEGQPIGSKAIAESSKLDISAATVRNVMSDLEGMGMVKSPSHFCWAVRLSKVTGFSLILCLLLSL